MKRFNFIVLISVLFVGLAVPAFAGDWHRRGGCGWPQGCARVEPNYGGYGYGYRRVDPTTAAIAVIGLGALTVWDRSNRAANTVGVVREQERTERLRIHADLADKTFGREGSSSVFSNEGNVVVSASSRSNTPNPPASQVRRTTLTGVPYCTDAELKSVGVGSGTGYLQNLGGGRCYYNYAIQ